MLVFEDFLGFTTTIIDKDHTRETYKDHGFAKSVIKICKPKFLSQFKQKTEIKGCSKCFLSQFC